MPTCKISNKKIHTGEAIYGADIKPGILKCIQHDYSSFTSTDCISLSELNRYRRLYLTSLMEEEKGALQALDADVMDAIKNNTILSENVEEISITESTLGQRVADKIAAFGGSWSFISVFFSFIILWMTFNTISFLNSSFDPYPFILLNLILSCIAAIQAPVIMMSQNRQEQKDRIRAEHDYKINLKAELEIKLLSEKIDHLLVHQNKKLLEIQELQTDYLNDILKEVKK